MRTILYPEEMKKTRVEYRTYLYLILTAFVDTLIIESFNHKAFTSGLSSMWEFLSQHPLAFAVDVFLVLLTLLPGLFLRRRIFWCALVSAIWLMAGGVNGFIVLNRMTPFTTADLTVINAGLDTLPNYLSKGYTVLLCIAAAGLLVGLLLVFLKGPKSMRPLRSRALSGIIALAVSFAGLFGCCAAAFDQRQLSTVFSNLAFAYEDYGFPYCFLQTWLNKGIRQPAGYSERDMKRILESVGEEPGAEATDVNVIFVQLESFMDPEMVKGLELSGDAVPFWHQLEQEFSSGDLTVPVVGAGTANTEFEVLTGMSTRMFGPGEYPYKTCLLENTVESAAYNLLELGYGTHAIHNHRATFYGRNEVYANLGFQDFTSLEYMPKTQKTAKGWCKDYILTNEIKKALDSTEDQPDLVFTVSVQGHGSYPKDEILEQTEIKVEACPEHMDIYSAEYYVNQLYEMDRFVRKLTESLERRDEKTILILYGDHLPSLNLEPEDMESGSLFKTEYVIWNNFGLEQEDQDLAAYQLSSVVLERLGITNGIVNRFHQICKDKPSYRSDLRKIQYDVLYGSQYLYDGNIPYKTMELEMGCQPIEITQMFAHGEKWYIQGKNFTPYCEVTLDDKLLNTTYISSTVLRLEETPREIGLEDLYISVVDKHHEILSDTE